MTLAQLQAEFGRFVLALEPAQEAAPDFIRGHLDVYAEMYWLRLRDVLFEDFPACRAALGDESFEVLVARYLRAHPSRHHSLGMLGAHVPGYLAAHPVEGAPYLAALACLERARVEALVAPDGPTVSLAAFAQVPPDSYGEARFTLHPSVRLLSLSHAVREAHEGLLQDATVSAPPARPEEVVVWRKDFTVLHAAVGAAESRALRLAAGGAPVQDVFLAFADEADPAQATFQAVGSWLSGGLVQAVGEP